MRPFAPSKSQRNHSLGLFKAGSLGSIQKPAKPIDMEVVKDDIRRQRRILSGEFQTAEAEAERAKKKLRASKAWWHTRRNWISVRVGNRIGKLTLSSGDGACGGWVEFPDGNQKWFAAGQIS